ncbi:MAG: peptidase S16 [Chromatiaceae bacterium]|nr:MAG: peptidase S16 [Chromatiaceae bacterium]
MRNPFLPKFSDLPEVLPIFPLSGAVVMPGVQLPLNIFEPRYLNLVQGALASDHLIGMVQPKGEDNFDEHPLMHRVGCAGRITSYSETNDGRIVIVLTGLCRFEIEAELTGIDGYRRVRPRWRRFVEDYQEEYPPLPEREQFMGSLRTFCDQQSVEVPWDDIARMADSDLVNLLCAHLPLGSDDKQALIETVGLHDRALLMRGLMDMSASSRGLATEQRH